MTLMVFTFGFNSIQAQDLFAKANKQFELGAYDLAIYNYQKLLKDEPQNVSVIGNLAEAYFRTQNYMEAIRWYEELGTYDNMEPRHILNYAHVMKSLGLYDKAQIWYWKYKDIDSNTGDHFALSCDHAKLFLQEEDNYDVSLFKANSPSTDFGVSFYNDKLIFCSFRTDMKREGGKRNFSHVQKEGNQLFVCADKNNVNFTNINFLRDELKEIHNIGPLAYSTYKVAYTKNNFADGYKQISGTETDLNIFLADVVDAQGDFDNEKAFIHNTSGSSTAFPTFMNNGNTLIFSSNRVGGNGGFDLYISQLEQGEWSEPVNMGPRINSPGNEITPSAKGNMLYFSSDYISGIGGYDVFKTSINFDGSYGSVENLGKGVNSPMDDYYYSVDPSNGLAYFSSNRLGGKGKEDIYMAKFLGNNASLSLNEAAIPQAVNLEDLAANKSMNTTNSIATTISFNEIQAKKVENTETPAVIIPEITNEIITKGSIQFDEEETLAPVTLTKENVIVNVADDEIIRIAEDVFDSESTVNASVVIGTDNTFDLKGAMKIAHNDLITDAGNVYFIQLASLSRTSGDIRPFMSLSELGNLYKVKKGGVVKIRMGYFFDETEATDKLREVKNRGFRDAFVVYEPLITSELELVNVGSSKTYYEGDYIPSNTVSNYKIRLASYTDPLWFDSGSVKDVGEIEQWTKGDFTIFVLSGYKNAADAEAALIKVINRGYTEAHLVEDVNGYLQKVQRN